MARRNLNLTIVRLATARLVRATMEKRYMEALDGFRTSYVDLLARVHEFAELDLILLRTGLGKLYPTVANQVVAFRDVVVKSPFPDIPYSLRKDNNYEPQPVWKNWIEGTLSTSSTSIMGNDGLAIDLEFDTCGTAKDFVNDLFRSIEHPDWYWVDEDSTEDHIATVQLVGEFMKEHGGWVHTFHDAHKELGHVFADMYKLVSAVEKAVGSRPAWKRVQTEVPELVPFLEQVIEEGADEQSTLAVSELIACVADSGGCE